MQTWAAAVSPMPQLIFTHSPFPAYALTAVDDAADGAGVYLSCAPHSRYKCRLSVFIVQCVTQQPADGGLPWPPWTSRASFRNRRSLARSMTHCHTSRVHHIIAAEVFFCVCVCFCLSDFSRSLHSVYQTQEILTQLLYECKDDYSRKGLVCFMWLIVVAAFFFCKINWVCIGIKSNPCMIFINQTLSSSFWLRCILWNLLLHRIGCFSAM